MMSQTIKSHKNLRLTDLNNINHEDDDKFVKISTLPEHFNFYYFYFKSTKKIKDSCLIKSLNLCKC